VCVLCRPPGKYEVLGATIDDALGEALDKAARLVGLGTAFSGGGAALERAARGGEVTAASRLTVPLLRQRNCDFSYSGLKNGFRMAVARAREGVGADSSASNAPLEPHAAVQETVALPAKETADLCAGFQEAAFRHAEDR
jgi:N6-L-threonylcarbamoyladenine synthase